MISISTEFKSRRKCVPRFHKKVFGATFQSNIEIFAGKIVEYDKVVRAALNKWPGRPIKSRSVKSIRSKINQPYFSCKKCDDAFDSYSKLRGVVRKLDFI